MTIRDKIKSNHIIILDTASFHGKNLNTIMLRLTLLSVAFEPAIASLFVSRALFQMYRVFLKKVFHKRREKMQEKMKTTWQKNENLVQVQQQCSVHFCLKIIFES